MLAAAIKKPSRNRKHRFVQLEIRQYGPLFISPPWPPLCKGGKGIGASLRKGRLAMRKLLALACVVVLSSCFALASARAADAAKIVLVAGRPSHGPGDHEFNAGCKLLAKCLGEVQGVEPVFVRRGMAQGRVGL